MTRKASLQTLSPLTFLRPLQYKVELRVRNHNTLTRMEIIQEVAKCMPENYVVDLDNPEVFVLVEVFKVRNRVSVKMRPDLSTGRAFVA